LTYLSTTGAQRFGINRDNVIAQFAHLRNDCSGSWRMVYRLAVPSPTPSIAAIAGTNSEHASQLATGPQACCRRPSWISWSTAASPGSKFNRLRDIPLSATSPQKLGGW